MKFHAITLFPDSFKALQYGITHRALEKGLIELTCHNPRDHTTDNYHTVDDRPYGGGPGMVMLAEPLLAAINAAKAQSTTAKTIYLSPQGQPLSQTMLATAAQQHTDLILVCGRYEGIDQRIIDGVIDEEWSLGDYVLSGGELGAMVVIDGITRLLPDALGHPQSAWHDSFSQALLDHPHYTRPPEFNGQTVPEVLLSGDHARIKKWRLKHALGKTWQKRPDIIARLNLTDGQKCLLNEYLNEQDDAVE